MRRVRIENPRKICPKALTHKLNMSTMSRPNDIKSPLCPVLLMIGAAASAIEAAVQRQPRSRVVLVEPDPDLAGQIKTRHGAQTGLTVLAGTVAEEAIGEGDAPVRVELVQYNQPGLRSTAAPTDHLTRLFPGLKARRTQEVRRIALAQVLQEAGLDEPQNGPSEDPESAVEIWLDNGGNEAGLLRALITRAGFSRVARIVLRCGLEPLFQGAASAADVTDLLQSEGFKLIATGGDDPDWPELQFERDPVVMGLRQALADQKHARETAEAQLGSLRQNLSQASDALELETAKRVALGEKTKTQSQTIADLEARLGSAEQSLSQASDALELETAKRAALNEKTKTQSQTIADLEAQLGSVKQSLSQASDALDVETGKCNVLEERLEQARAKNSEQAAEISDHAAQLKAAADQATAQANKQTQKALQQAEQTASAARADLALALRMQTLAQSDLQDLQARYARSEQTCRSQATLLQKLTPRLQQAAAQLQALTQSGDSAFREAEMLANPETGPETGSKPKPKPKAKAARTGRVTKPAAKKARSAKPAPQPTPKPETPR